MNDASSIIRSIETYSNLQYLANNTQHIKKKNKDNTWGFLNNCKREKEAWQAFYRYL